MVWVLVNLTDVTLYLFNVTHDFVIMVPGYSYQT